MASLKAGKKTGLKYFGYADIKAWEPCYDPIKFVPATWRGTAIDILNLSGPSNEDKIWVILRTEIVSERVMRLFAVWCARQSAKYVLDAERPKYLALLDVIERFANGEATEAERDAAWDAARAAARAAQLAKLREKIEAEGKERKKLK